MKHGLTDRLHSINVDQIISLGLVIILLTPIWNGAIFSIFDRFGILGKSQMDTLLFVLETMLMGLAFVMSIKREIRATSLTWGVAVLVVLTEALLFPANIPAMKEYARGFCLFALPAFCMAYAVNDRGVLLRQLDSTVYPSVAAIVIYGLFAETRTYSMWYGYAALVPMLMLGMRCIRRNQAIDYIIFSVLFIMLLLKASRGSVLTIFMFLVVFLVAYTYRTRNDSAQSLPLFLRAQRYILFNRRFRFIALTVFTIALALILLQPVAQMLQSLLEGIGISARTVNIFANKGIFYLSKREIWIENLTEAIMTSPLLGLGLCGDSVFMVHNVFHYPSNTYSVDWHYMGNYSHNMVLELTSHFGITVGLLFLFLILLLAMSAFRKAHFSADFDSFDVILVMTTVLVSLQFSGTYLTSTMFWLFLGLIVKSHAKAYNAKRENSGGSVHYANT